MTNTIATRALGAGLVLAAGLTAQSDAVTATGFAAPVRLKAGAEFMGGKRLYPSPVFHDVNGDGQLDIVIGDLRGHLTVSLRRGAAMDFAAETRLMSADGRLLKFHNW